MNFYSIFSKIKDSGLIGSNNNKKLFYLDFFLQNYLKKSIFQVMNYAQKLYLIKL